MISMSLSLAHAYHGTMEQTSGQSTDDDDDDEEDEDSCSLYYLKWLCVDNTC